MPNGIHTVDLGERLQVFIPLISLFTGRDICSVGGGMLYSIHTVDLNSDYRLLQ